MSDTQDRPGLTAPTPSEYRRPLLGMEPKEASRQAVPTLIAASRVVILAEQLAEGEGLSATDILTAACMAARMEEMGGADFVPNRLVGRPDHD